MHPARRLITILSLLALAGCARGLSLHAVLPALPNPCRVVRESEIPLTLHHGSLLVPARIDGQDVQLIVDTGAEYGLVTPEAVERLGLVRDPSHRTQLTGTGGRVTSANAMISRFSVGGLTRADQSVIVGPPHQFSGIDPPIAGVLSANFLSQYDLEFDVPHGRLTLYRVSECKGDFLDWKPPAFRIRITRSPPNHVEVPVVIDGHTVNALFDTGAWESVVKTEIAEGLGISSAELAMDPGGDSGGVDQNRFAYYRHAFDMVRIGEETFHHWPLDVAPFTLPGESMLLGADYLRSHRVWLSYATNQLFVEPLDESSD